MWRASGVAPAHPRNCVCCGTDGHIVTDKYENRAATPWFHTLLAMKASFTTGLYIRVNQVISLLYILIYTEINKKTRIFIN